MVETIDELRPICQKPRYKEVGNWYARHIIRDAALYVTWLFLHTNITANQITALSIAVGLVAGAAFMIPTPAGFLAGAILLQIWYLLDHVDGQVARYRKSASLTGVYFDYISHYLVHSAVFLGLAFGAYFYHGHLIFLVLGFMASLFMAFVSMFYDAKWKAFYHWFDVNKIQRADFIWPVGADLRVRPEEGQTHRSAPTFAKSIFVFLCKLTEIHVILNLLTLFGILGMGCFEIIGLSLPELFVLSYSLLLPFVFIVRVLHAIKTRSLDEEFRERVKLNV